MIGVNIIHGFYKGYRGIVLNSNANNKTYTIHLEANGVVTTVPIKYTVLADRNVDFKSLDYNEIPENFLAVNGNIFYNGSDTQFQKDVLNDNEELNGEDLIDNYIDDVIESNEQKNRRKLSKDDNIQFLQGYNEQYNIKTGISFTDLKLFYPDVNKKTIDLLYEYVEDICNILGIEPVYNPQSMYLSHIDKILEIINGKTIEVPTYIKQKLIEMNKQSDLIVKDNKTFYSKQGLKNHLIIDDLQIKYITACYFYFYINNMGIRNQYNLKALDFMKSNDITNTSKNYFLSCLQVSNYFTTNKKIISRRNSEMIKDYSLSDKLINKLSIAISKLQPLDYTLIPDTIITGQSNIIFKHLKTGERIDRPNENFIKKNIDYQKKRQLLINKNRINIFKIQNKNDLTKKVERTNPLEDKLLIGKARLISIEKNIPLFKQGLYKLYLFIKDQEQERPFDTVVKNDVSVLENILTNIYDTSKFIDFYTQIKSFSNIKDIPESSKIYPLLKNASSKLVDVIINYSNQTSKIINDYATEYIKEFYSTINNPKNDITIKLKNDDIFSYTYSRIKNDYLNMLNELYLSDKLNQDKKERVKFIINNYDRILQNTLIHPEKIKYNDEIIEVKAFFTKNYNILIHGEGSSKAKLASKSHYTSYFEMAKSKAKANKLAYKLQQNLDLNERKLLNSNEVLNKEISNLIEADTTAKYTLSDYKKMIEDKGVIKKSISKLDYKFADYFTKPPTTNKVDFLINTAPLTYTTGSKRKASVDLVEKSKKEKLINLEVSKNLVNKYLDMK